MWTKNEDYSKFINIRSNNRSNAAQEGLQVKQKWFNQEKKNNIT